MEKRIIKRPNQNGKPNGDQGSTSNATSQSLTNPHTGRTIKRPQINMSNRRRLLPVMDEDQRRIARNTMMRLIEAAGGQTLFGSLFGISRQHVQNFIDRGYIGTYWVPVVYALDAVREVARLSSLRPDFSPDRMHTVSQSPRINHTAMQRVKELNEQGYRFPQKDSD